MSEPVRLSVLCCTFLAASVVVAQPLAALPVPTDLREDGREAERDGKALILFFSFPGCQFCHVVRQNYLSPLLRTEDARQRPTIRELDITSTRAVKGFDGFPATHHTLARRYGIRVAPTVLFVDARGRLLVPPIVGGDVSGMYGAYLDNGFSEARKKLSADPAKRERGGKE